MLSQTTEYALAAAVHLAVKGGGGPVRVDDIAEELGVPRNYLSKILHALARVGVLNSTRGPGGGFELARDASEIRLSELVQPFEPALTRSNGGCLLGRERCGDDDPCAAHSRWKDVRATIDTFFSDTTLGDLAQTRPAERSVG